MHTFDWLVRGCAFVALGLLWEHIVEALTDGQSRYIYAGVTVVFMFRFANTKVSPITLANTAYVIHVFMDGVLASILSARVGTSAGWAVEAHAIAHGCTLLLASIANRENRQKGFLVGGSIQALAPVSFMCGTASVGWTSQFATWLPEAALGSAAATLVLLIWKPCIHKHTPPAKS